MTRRERRLASAFSVSLQQAGTVCSWRGRFFVYWQHATRALGIRDRQGAIRWALPAKIVIGATNLGISIVNNGQMSPCRQWFDARLNWQSRAWVAKIRRALLAKLRSMQHELCRVFVV